MDTHSRKLICSKPGEPARFHRAGRILVDPWTAVENGCVEIAGNRIISVRSHIPQSDVIDHGPGVLMSPLVNAHLHLELSALKNCVSFDRGFRAWVRQLLEKRAAVPEQEMIRAVESAARKMNRSGHLWVGDIASLDTVRPLVPHLGLKGLFFQEFLGVRQPDVDFRKEADLTFGVAGHAPHTTSPDVLTFLKQAARSNHAVFSIHLAESTDESEFTRSRKGAWADFLTARGIDFSTWKIKAGTPVAHARSLGLLDETTIGVHLLDTTDDDLDILAGTGTKVCLCPRSNQNLHNRLPRIEKMMEKGIKPALGTDSLASCPSLDIMDEMAHVHRHYPSLDPGDILAMGTVNGAHALGAASKTGTLEPGKSGDLLYLPVTAQTTKALIERIVSNES